MKDIPYNYTKEIIELIGNYILQEYQEYGLEVDFHMYKCLSHYEKRFNRLTINCEYECYIKPKNRNLLSERDSILKEIFLDYNGDYFRNIEVNNFIMYSNDDANKLWFKIWCEKRVNR
jgi:hypothetical protein